MRLKIQRSVLANAFQVVSGVVPARTPRDILKKVLLSVGDGGAVLAGTDQEVGIRHVISEVEVESPGEMLLPTARVASILRELSDPSIDIELDGDAILLRAGSSEFRLSSEDPAEFPPVANFEDQAYYIVEAGAFRQMIRRTIFATDTESTRYALGGVLVELSPESITLAATDSRRLAVTSGPCRMEGLEDVAGSSPVVPSKALSLLERSLPTEGEVHLAVHNNDIIARAGDTVISSRLVDGRFPKYRDVIPKQSSTVIDLVAGVFHAAVRQSQIVTDNDSRGVDFSILPGTMRLTSQSSDVGASKIEFPIAYDGEPLTTRFEPKFVSEFLRVLEPETTIQLKLIDGDSAAVFTVDDGYTYVIMPLSREP